MVQHTKRDPLLSGLTQNDTTSGGGSASPLKGMNYAQGAAALAPVQQKRKKKKGPQAPQQAPPNQTAVAPAPSVLRSMADLPKAALGWLMPTKVGDSAKIETSIKAPFSALWFFGEVGAAFGLEAEVELGEDGYEVEASVAVGPYGAFGKLISMCGSFEGKVSVSAKSKDPALVWQMLSFALREHMASINARVSGWCWGDYETAADDLLAKMGDDDEFGLAYAVGAKVEGQSSEDDPSFEGELGVEATREWTYKKRKTSAKTEQGIDQQTDMTGAEKDRIRSKRGGQSQKQKSKKIAALSSKSEDKATVSGKAALNGFGLEGEFEFEYDTAGELTLSVAVNPGEAIKENESVKALAARLQGMFGKAVQTIGAVAGTKAPALKKIAQSFAASSGKLAAKLKDALPELPGELSGVKVAIEAARSEKDGGGYEWEFSVKAVTGGKAEMLGGRVEAEYEKSRTLGSK